MPTYPTYKLGDICELLNGFAFKSSNYVQSGLRVIRITNVKKGYVIDEEPQFYPLETQEELKKYILKKGDLLISLTGNVGRVGILSEDLLPAALNQRVGCLRVKDKSLVSLQYLFHLLNTNSFEKDCINSSKGIAQKNMSTEWLKEYEISLPSLATQHAIVTRIESLFAELDKAVQHLRTAQQQLKTYRQAVLNHWLNNDEGKWKMVKLGEVIEKPTYGTSKKCDYDIVGTGVLRIPNIGNGYIIDEDLKFAVFSDEEKEKYSLKEGDLLTIRSNGSVDLVGKCALISSKEEKYLFAGYLIRLRPFPEKVNSKFLLLTLESHKLRIQIEDKAKSTSGVNNINSVEIQNLEIPHPPLAEQQRIVKEIESRLSQATATETYIENALQQAEALRQSILKKAFSGELVVSEGSTTKMGA